MKRMLVVLYLLIPLHAIGTTEAEFQKCVQVKDVIIAIATQADKGVTRADLKRKTQLRSMDDLVDWVYDFRGAYTNQQLAQKQFELCLSHFK